MDALNIESISQGVGKQVSTASTQKKAPVEDAKIRDSERAVAKELNNRIEHILKQLKDSGVEISSHSGIKKPHASVSDHIDALRDVLTGKTSVDKLKFSDVVDSIPVPILGSADGAPIYPFDRNFLQLNLEYLRALMTGGADVDQEISDRIESQLSTLSAPAVDVAETSENKSLGASTIDELV